MSLWRLICPPAPQTSNPTEQDPNKRPTASKQTRSLGCTSLYLADIYLDPLSPRCRKGYRNRTGQRWTIAYVARSQIRSWRTKECDRPAVKLGLMLKLSRVLAEMASGVHCTGYGLHTNSGCPCRNSSWTQPVKSIILCPLCDTATSLWRITVPIFFNEELLSGFSPCGRHLSNVL